MTASDDGPTDDEPSDAEPTNDGLTDQDIAQAPRGRARRAPRYAAFVTTGALLGLGAAVALTLALPPVDQLGAGSALGYLALVLGLIGGLVGAAVSVVMDRRAG